MRIKSKYDPDDSLSPQAWANASISFPLKTWSLHLYFIILQFWDVTNLMPMLVYGSFHNIKGGRQVLMEGEEKGGWEKEKERGRGENGSE